MMMVEGRFQAAFLGAKLLAAKALDNPIVDLSQSIGGAIFGNRDDEAAAIDASLFCSLNCRTRSLGEK